MSLTWVSSPVLSSIEYIAKLNKKGRFGVPFLLASAFGLIALISRQWLRRPGAGEQFALLAP